MWHCQSQWAGGEDTGVLPGTGESQTTRHCSTSHTASNTPTQETSAHEAESRIQPLPHHPQTHTPSSSTHGASRPQCRAEQGVQLGTARTQNRVTPQDTTRREAALTASHMCRVVRTFHMRATILVVCRRAVSQRAPKEAEPDSLIYCTHNTSRCRRGLATERIRREHFPRRPHAQGWHGPP